MKIEVVGRNVEVTNDFREQIHKRFVRTARQVSEHARLEVVLREEANPAITESRVAEATLYLKGKTLHAKESSPRMLTAIRALSDDIQRQVKRHRELRRRRSRTRRPVSQMRQAPESPGAPPPAV